MRTDKFDIFKAIFNDNRSKYFHSPSVFASYYSDFLMYSVVSHSMVPYLDFLAKEGAMPTSNHLTTLINNWDTLHGVDIVRWLVNNGIQVDRSHVESAIFCSNVSALRCFVDLNFPLRAEKHFVHQAAENIDVETVKFLLDEVGLQVSIPELLKDIRIAWENSVTIEEKRTKIRWAWIRHTVVLGSICSPKRDIHPRRIGSVYTKFCNSSRRTRKLTLARIIWI